MTMLELHLVHTNVFIMKKSCKGCLVGSADPSDLKIIFVLLTKIITVYVQFTIIYIWHFSFNKLLIFCLGVAKSVVRLLIIFYELF